MYKKDVASERTKNYFSVMMVEIVMTIMMMMMMMSLMMPTAAWRSEMIPPVGLKYIEILFMYIYMILMKDKRF